jgi:hypothetical protein
VLYLYDSGTGSILWCGEATSIVSTEWNAGAWVETFEAGVATNPQLQGTDTTTAEVEASINVSAGYLTFEYDSRTYRMPLIDYQYDGSKMFAGAPGGIVYEYQPASLFGQTGPLSTPGTASIVGTIQATDITNEEPEGDEPMSVNEIPVKSYLNLERDPVNDYHAATKNYVNVTVDAAKTWVTNQLAGYSASTHTHAASAITTGIFDSDRLPRAVGTSTYGAVRLDSGSGLTLIAGELSLDDEAVRGIVIGTAAGFAPALGSDGKLSTSVIPSLAITDTFTADSETAMTALSAAEKGDVCIRTDLNKTFILTSDAANAYATASNWVALATPTDLVTSVNSQTGNVAITAASLGLVTSANLAVGVATASEAKFPSEKALCVHVQAKIDALADSLGQAAAKDTVTSYTLEGLEAEEGLVEGAGLLMVLGDFLDTYLMAYGTDGSGISVTNDTKFVTAKAAKKIADDAAASATAAAAKGRIFAINGNGTTTEFTCTHELGIANILAQVYDGAGAQVWVATEKTATTVTFKFATAPAAGTTLTAVIIGVADSA